MWTNQETLAQLLQSKRSINSELEAYIRSTLSPQALTAPMRRSLEDLPE